MLLGSPSPVPDRYAPQLLAAIERGPMRADIGVVSEGALPFAGHDLWNAHEFSWLDERGCPDQAVVQFLVPCISTKLVESKSLKLYLNSLAQTSFSGRLEVLQCITADIGRVLDSDVKIEFLEPGHPNQEYIQEPRGVCLEVDRPVITEYQTAPLLLIVDSSGPVVRETVFTRLFRCLCPVTGQPDSAWVQIEYTGCPIEHAGLLRYLVSYRQARGFHEQVVERIFMDLMRCCKPEVLTVTARFERRGGIDINPMRYWHPDTPGMGC